MGLAATIVENTDLLQATLPRQINQSEEGELQECIQGQWRCKIECAFPVFRSKEDEADWGDEPQERDRYPDDDELDQSVANHCLQRLWSSRNFQRRLRGYHSSTQEESDGGSVGPLPDKEGNDVGGCRNRFSRPRTDTTSNNTTMAKKKSKTVSPYFFS